MIPTLQHFITFWKIYFLWNHITIFLTFPYGRNFMYYFQYFNNDLDCWSGRLKNLNVHFHLTLDWNNVVWSIWWLKQSIKPFILNESVIAITNTNCVYFLSCVWVFRFLKVQKFNFSPTLALNYTKAILSRVGLTRLHQRYFLKKMLFNDVISFVWFIYISQIRNLFYWCGKVTNFFSSQLTSEKRSLFQDVIW